LGAQQRHSHDILAMANANDLINSQ